MDDVQLANVEGNISAMVQIGSVGGAALYVQYWLRIPGDLGTNKSTVLSFSAIVLAAFGPRGNSAVFGSWVSLSSLQMVAV